MQHVSGIVPNQRKCFKAKMNLMKICLSYQKKKKEEEEEGEFSRHLEAGKAAK